MLEQIVRTHLATYFLRSSQTANRYKQDDDGYFLALLRDGRWIQVDPKTGEPVAPRWSVQYLIP